MSCNNQIVMFVRHQTHIVDNCAWLIMVSVNADHFVTVTSECYNSLIVFVFVNYNSIIQTKEEQIIEIKTQKLEWPVAPEVASEEFLFVWGWPGPDYNTYLRKDYGQTWAYTKEELL